MRTSPVIFAIKAKIWLCWIVQYALRLQWWNPIHIIGWILQTWLAFWGQRIITQLKCGVPVKSRFRIVFRIQIIYRNVCSWQQNGFKFISSARISSHVLLVHSISSSVKFFGFVSFAIQITDPVNTTPQISFNFEKLNPQLILNAPILFSVTFNKNLEAFFKQKFDTLIVLS